MPNTKLLNLLEALMQIAQNTPYGATQGSVVCKSLGLPARYLEADLQNLVKSGILKSVRGPKGGYVLAREKRNITVADIQNSLEEVANSGGLQGFLVQKLKSYANKVTLHELIQEATSQGVLQPPSQKPDFAI